MSQPAPENRLPPCPSTPNCVSTQAERAGQLIHFRSASRLARSDFGVNRRRMEEVRSAFLAES